MYSFPALTRLPPLTWSFSFCFCASVSSRRASVASVTSITTDDSSSARTSEELALYELLFICERTTTRSFTDNTLKMDTCTVRTWPARFCFGFAKTKSKTVCFDRSKYHCKSKKSFVLVLPKTKTKHKIVQVRWGHCVLWCLCKYCGKNTIAWSLNEKLKLLWCRFAKVRTLFAAEKALFEAFLCSKLTDIIQISVAPRFSSDIPCFDCVLGYVDVSYVVYTQPMTLLVVSIVNDLK